MKIITQERREYGMEKRIDIFDSLKGIAIMGVILIHSGNNVPRNLDRIAEAVISNGNKGVQIFFIISAILFYKSFDSYYSTYGYMNMKLAGKWYGRRFLRLIPLYWLTNTAVLLFGSVKSAGISLSALKIYLSNCLFIHGFIPEYINAIGNNWYIGTLAIFILLVPLCYLYITNILRAFGLLGISMLLQQVISITIVNWNFGQDMQIWENYWNGFSIFKQMPVLTVGIILYYLLFVHKIHERAVSILMDKYGHKITRIIIYIFFMAVCLIFAYDIITYQNIYVFSGAIGLLFIILFCYPVPLVVNRGFAFIGRYSYGIYLFHLLILGRINNLVSIYLGNSLGNIIISAIITLCVCLMASVVLTRYFEKPIIDFVRSKVDKRE